MVRCGIAVLAVGLQNSAEPRLAEVQVVQGREARDTLAARRGQRAHTPGEILGRLRRRRALGLDLYLVIRVRSESFDPHAPRAGAPLGHGPHLAVDEDARASGHWPGS